MAAVERLLVHHHSAEYIFGSFRTIEFIVSQSENIAPLKAVLAGVAGVHISLLVMNRLNRIEFAIFISLMHFLFPKALTIQNLFNPTLNNLETNS